MEKLEGDTAVVTGGASGMGLAFAHRFAEAGMNVVLADIEAEPLAMAEASVAAKGVKVMPVRTDVANPEEIEALATKAYGRFGKVNILCNKRASVAAPATCGNSLRRTGSGSSTWTSGASSTACAASSRG